ncbi:MAG TPA: FAD:protein FMN transferase [Myxococcota bacterium]|jgi:thiamine biosynthesis lipoprotein
MMKLELLALCALGALTASCAHGFVDVPLEGETMGSTWHIKLKVPSDQTARAQAMQKPIEATLARIVAEMSTYEPSSEISRFNAWKSTAPFPCSHEVAVVVTESIEVGHDTDGAFDITVDPLINLWGFDRKGPRDTPPAENEIALAQEHVGLAHIKVVGDAISKDDPEVTINLGGIAAGFSVDVVAAQLEAAGFHDMMVEITGELIARGTSSKGRPWNIGIKTPDIDAHDVVTSVPVTDKAVTTSGSYHNFFEANGKRYSHIIDPVTGAPVQTDLVSVTVLADDALTADGYDTPFIIIGEERARAVMAKKKGMEALFIHAVPGANGAVTWKITRTDGFPR